MRLVLAVMAAGLAGCAVGGDSQVGLMIASGELRVEQIAADPTHLTVTIRSNDWTGTYERPDVQARIVESALGRQCGTPTIKDRRVMNFGTTPIGVPVRLHILTVRCPNGATSPE